MAWWEMLYPLAIVILMVAGILRAQRHNTKAYTDIEQRAQEYLWHLKVYNMQSKYWRAYGGPPPECMRKGCSH